MTQRAASIALEPNGKQARSTRLAGSCVCGGSSQPGACGSCGPAHPISLQRKAVDTAQVDDVQEAVGSVLEATGEPLDPRLRRFMEPRFGEDFSRVRVHRGTEAAESARAVRARAYTVGNDVVFAAGQFEPHTTRGAALLAHELAHVVQHGGSATAGGAGLAVVNDPAAEREADGAGARVSGGASVVGLCRAPAGGNRLQRQAESAPAPDAVGPVEAHQSRLLASFDTDSKEPKRRWNLDRLAKDAFDALTRSDRAVLQFRGQVLRNPSDPDPEGTAYGRADVSRQALVQWLGPTRFSERRFEVTLDSAGGGGSQVEVWVIYTPEVLPNGRPVERREPMGPPRPGPKAVPPSDLPDIGLDKFTNPDPLTYKGREVFVLKLGKEVRFSTPALWGPRSVMLTLSGETDLEAILGDLITPAPSAPESAAPPANIPRGGLAPPSSATPPAPPAASAGEGVPAGPEVKPGPGVSFGLSLLVTGSERLSVTTTGKVDLTSRKATAGISFTIVGTDCQFMVPASVLTKAAEAMRKLKLVDPAALVKDVPKPGPAPPSGPPPPPAGEMLKVAQAVDVLYQQVQAVKRAAAACQKSKITIGPSVTVPFGEQKPGEPRSPTYNFNITFEFP